MSEPKTDDTMVAALLHERAGYAQRGLTDRVAQVDQQLKLRGHEAAAEQRAASQPATAAPKRRGRPRKQTAEQPPAETS